MLSWTLASDSVLTLITDDCRKLTATASHPYWARIMELVRKLEWDEVERLISLKEMVADYFEGSIAIQGGQVYYRGNQALHGKDVERTLDLMRMGIPVRPMVRFLENKMANPSRRAIDEMYKFLDHKGLSLTPNGTILGYKGVQNNWYSVMGNKETVVLQGKTDEGGHILNTIGATIEVARNSVCDDYKQGCANGLHIGSREYAEGWGGPDNHVLLVEFSPADVVSVPDDCECQKLRACKYKILGEVQKEVKLSDTYTADYTPQPEWDEDPDADFEDETVIEDSQSDEIGQHEEEYDNGYDRGAREGKAHKRRFYTRADESGQVTPSNSADYIKGYNDGYQSERQSQRRTAGQ